MMEDFFAGLLRSWPEGHEQYCWHALPEPHPAGILAQRYREAVRVPGLVPVRPEWMHVAVQRVALAGEVGAADLGRMIRLVQRRFEGIAPFTATLGTAEIWETAVACPARPVYLLGVLREVVAEVIWEVTGERPTGDGSAYRPHLTVARAIGPVDDQQVRDKIAECGADVEPLSISRLVLAAQRHDRYEITGRVLDGVTLRG
jgi:2'-5' RNA ligase